MSLSETLQRRLSEQPPGAGRQVLTATDEAAGWTVELTADRTDQVGCLAWELRARRAAAPAALDAEGVRAWADRVARRATGLLEQLRVIEVDAPRRVAMLRSHEPAARGDDLHYYEVLLTGAGDAGVRRYHASRQGSERREQVPFALTHEALGKLADDLTADQ